MTTIGVKPVPVERVNPIHIPSYSYHHPSVQRAQLAAALDAQFHQKLPSLRRMGMGTARLPDEHCRSTTACRSDDYKRATSTLLEAPKRQVSTEFVTETGKQLYRTYTTSEELKRTRTEWSDFLNRSPERFNIRIPDLPTAKEQYFVGYSIRYLRPDLTKPRRYTLAKDPTLDQFGEHLMSANDYAQFRDAYPLFHRNVSLDAWK